MVKITIPHFSLPHLSLIIPFSSFTDMAPNTILKKVLFLFAPTICDRFARRFRRDSGRIFSQTSFFAP